MSGAPPSEPIVYLDHAATTPLAPAARQAWLETVDALAANPGNPAALHSGGRSARSLLEDARERLAVALGAERAEVVFTSGATESAALAIGGSVRQSQAGRQDRGEGRLPPLGWVCSGVEHPAVLAQGDFDVSGKVSQLLLPTNESGQALADAATVAQTIDGHSVAVGSMALVCSETGVIQPLEQFRDVLRDQEPHAYVHSDATQAVGNLPVSFADLGLDLMTIGGHKFGAPVGTGALFVRRGLTLRSDRLGGGQERGIRSGTPDVAGAVALSIAAESAQKNVACRVHHAQELRDKLLAGLPPGVVATSSAASVPSIIHLSLPTAHPEVLLLEMDRRGICVSAGSACHAGVTRPSPVLLQMGRSESQALGVLRVSVGPKTRAADIDRFLWALPAALEQAQRMDDYDARNR